MLATPYMVGPRPSLRCYSSEKRSLNIQKKQYLPEIDGLRAVSVLLILYYHLKLPGLFGGFVGVDVFFVISGFLITRLLLADLEAGAFSLADFYRRRFTRILPALFATIFVVLILALIIYPPAALMFAMEQIIAATMSFSNFFYWAQSGYWAPSAQNSVLLHTWSLGVEEQFYLLFPLLLMLVFRGPGRKGLIVLAAVLFVASVALGEWVLKRDAAAAYFVSPLRFYGLGLGALAAGLEPLWRGRAGSGISSGLTLMGLTIICYAATYLNLFSGFPGLNALYPSVGSLLVILGAASPIALLLLANPIMRWLGRLSYALYLVHWPLIVFYRYLLGPDLSWIDQAVLAAASLLCAVLLHYGVEQRYRMTGNGFVTQSGVMTTRVTRGMGLSALLLVGIAVVTKLSGGWPSRIPADVQHLAIADVTDFHREVNQRFRGECKPVRDRYCGERDPNRQNIFLLGDSRGPDIYIALREAYPEHNVYASFAPGCVPVFNQAIGRSIFFEGCPQLNEQRLQQALDAPRGDIIFLGFSFNNWRAQAVFQTVERLLASGKRVVLLGESIFLRGKEPNQIAIDRHRYNLGDDYISRFLVARPFAVDATQAPKFRALGATYVTQHDFFYDERYRLFTADGESLLSYDGVHLTAAGAREFGHFLRDNYPLDRTSRKE